MARALLIAEKPSLMRDIMKVYKTMNMSDEIDFMAFAGHTMTALQPKEYKPEWGANGWSWGMLPMIPETYLMKVSSNKKKIYSEIKSKIKTGNYDYLINACDPDREGQAIFHYVIEHMGCNLPVKRFWQNSLTENNIKNALLNMKDNKKDTYFKNLTDASILRGRFDWLVGMNLTVAATLQMDTICKVGRVKTPTLKILVDRELEIKNFKPVTTYELEADFGNYKGVLIDTDGNVRFKQAIDADLIINSLSKNCVIESVESKVENINAPQLYNLSSLQTDAGKTFGYNAEKTKNIVQELYERKILSYPRTSNQYISSSEVDTFPKLLKSVSDVPELSSFATKFMKDIPLQQEIKNNKRYVNNKVMEESGHYAIIPTEENPKFNSLTQEQKNIYTMVSKRFIGMFMPPMKVSKTTMITNSNENKFKTTGKVVIDEGFNVIFKKQSNDVILPNLQEGTPVQLISTSIEEKISTPPSRFTEGTLIAAMENPSKFLNDNKLKDVMKAKKGIGTDATRDSIIKELMLNKYIESRKGKGKGEQLYATEQGIFIIQNLKDKDIASVDMTGIWEDKLSQVEKGEISKEQFNSEMEQYIINTITDFKNSQMKQGNNPNKRNSTAIGKCNCGNGQVGNVKDLYICNQYGKTCNFAIRKSTQGVEIKEEDIKQLLETGSTNPFIFTFINTDIDMPYQTRASLIFDMNEKKVKMNFIGGAEIGECPCCGENVLDTKTCYLCSGYFKKTCKFAINKIYRGSKIPISEAQKILNGKETKLMTFSFDDEKSGTAKKSKGKLYFNSELNQIRINFENNSKIIGKCPCCGDDVYEGKNFYLCKKYKNPCKLAIPKDYWGKKLGPTDVSTLIDGNSIKNCILTFGNGTQEKKEVYLDFEEYKLKSKK